MLPKILVADDDLDNRTIATEALEAAGYEVFCAVNGLEAVNLAVKELPDLILLDLSMPVMDGWHSVERLKNDPDTAKIPVIAFTAHALKNEMEKAKAAGCDDVLTKPCAPRQMIERVKQWLPKKS